MPQGNAAAVDIDGIPPSLQAQRILAGKILCGKGLMEFNRPIVRFPAIRDMIIQNECDIQAAAMLLYRAASAADSKKPWMGYAARAYYAACRTARKTALDGLQILGGYGYTMEFAAQRYLRDAMSLYNTGAESEELKSLIAEKAGFQAG